MSDAGYTLVETLTALAILALAIGGLAAGLQVLGGQQAIVGRAVADTQAVRAAQATLDRLFERRGPFRSHEPQRLTGGDRRIDFDCGRADPCAVELVDAASGLALRVEDGDLRTLPLRVAGTAHFVYQGALGTSLAWPPQRPDRQALRSISVVRDGAPGEGALLKSRLWIEQPVRCEFDVVMQDCR